MENGFGSENTRGVNTSEAAGAEAVMGCGAEEMDWANIQENCQLGFLACKQQKPAMANN